MIIQFNTDGNISGFEANAAFFSDAITEALRRFSDSITKVEVHLSDVNAHKNGPFDKRCMLEARVGGLQPISVTNHANTVEKAVTGAIEKLKTSLTKLFGKMTEH